MGRERECEVIVGRRRRAGRALLETEEIVFRSDDLRLRIPLGAIVELEVVDRDLRVAWGEERAAFRLGEKEAARWRDAIRNPKSRVAKLGVKRGQAVAVLDVDDAALVRELEAAGADVRTDARSKRLDFLFFGVSDRKDLERLVALRERIVDEGAIWIVRPKGSDAVRERDVLAAARAAGLVDVKVVKLSATHTAEKVVVPVAARKAAPRRSART